MSITCKSCGTANKDEAYYCRECGQKLSIDGANSSYKKQEASPADKGSKGALIFVAIAIIFVIGFSIYESNGGLSATTEVAPAAIEEVAPAAEAMPADAATEAAQPIQEQFYKTPTGGYYNILSLPEIRYCLAEKIKMQAINERIDNTSDEQIDKYNAMIQDMNSKCGQYQYHENDLTIATNEVEPRRDELTKKALKEFFPREKKSKTISESSNQALLPPNEPIQEILPKEPSVYGQ